MKIYLDDERDTPEGWVRAYWPDEVIDLLKTGKVGMLSLDHDLGDDERGTGYDVILWLEEQAAENKLKKLPLIYVHSANTSAKQKMEAGIASIERLYNSFCTICGNKKRGDAGKSIPVSYPEDHWICWFLAEMKETEHQCICAKCYDHLEKTVYPVFVEAYNKIKKR